MSTNESSLIRLPEVKRITGLSRSGIYQKIRQNEFPAPINLGPRAVAWLECEVRSWIDQRIQASRPFLAASNVSEARA